MADAARTSGSADRLPSAMKKPAAMPIGKVASDSAMVTAAPAASSSAQPSGPHCSKASSFSTPSQPQGSSRLRCRRSFPRLTAVGVELEVLVVDFLVLAVGVDRGEPLVEERLE